MTTDERKVFTSIRNRLVEEIERIDAMLEAKPATAPKPREIKKTPPGLLRIRRIFKHRDTTLPDSKEAKAYLELTKRYTKETFYESLDRMEMFYRFRSRRRGDEPDLWCHDSYTLINNWDKKEATALEFLKGKPTSGVNPAVKAEILPEPANWKERMAEMYPTSEPEKWTWTKLCRDYKDIAEGMTEK